MKREPEAEDGSREEQTKTIEFAAWELDRETVRRHLVDYMKSPVTVVGYQQIETRPTGAAPMRVVSVSYKIAPSS